MSGRSLYESAIDVHRERVLDETVFDLYSIMAGKETNEVNRIYRRESAVLFALFLLQYRKLQRLSRVRLCVRGTGTGADRGLERLNR